jgi:hypothetical protein
MTDAGAALPWRRALEVRDWRSACQNQRTALIALQAGSGLK